MIVIISSTATGALESLKSMPASSMVPIVDIMMIIITATATITKTIRQ